MNRVFTTSMFMAVLAAAQPGGAQGPTATPSGPAPTATPLPIAGPKPAAELTKLQFLVGDWVHEEIDHATGPGTRRAARSRTAWILGGHRLYITYKSQGSADEYEGRGLMGWDAEAKTYRLDWFDTRGLAQRYSGSFDPEDSLVFTAEYSWEGEPRRQQLTIKKQPSGKFLLTDSSASGTAPLKLTLESMASTAPVPTPTPTPAPTTAAPAGAAGSVATPAATPAARSTPAPPAR